MRCMQVGLQPHVCQLVSAPALAVSPCPQVRSVPEDPLSESEEESDGQYPVKEQA